ncbi:LysR family transcriptional regulator [Rhodoplanes roseus]|uniref:LysR family transcriptional regulator n=1 Tax=Rhodoplanes roseus TaxID=29409 RepID=UPI0014764C50|nr:LysR family transcriptional regulator [Rhodoplanes roseus]
MEIKELKSFCMVAKLASFSKASAALGIGQPAVTKHVKRLEAELGRTLVERGLRPLRLTAAGSNLFRMAEPLLEGLENLDRCGPMAVTAPINIAVPHGYVSDLLPEAVRALRTEWPAARVRIRSATKEEVFELVQTGSVDFAVAPISGSARQFAFDRLFPSERILITPADHAFVTTAPASLAEVARHPLVLPRFHTQTRALLEGEFRRLDLAYEVAVEVDGIDQLERYVELGVGLAVGLRGAASTGRNPRLGTVSLAAFLPSETIGIVRNRSLPLSEPAQALVAGLHALVDAPGEARPAKRHRDGTG